MRTIIELGTNSGDPKHWDLRRVFLTGREKPTALLEWKLTPEADFGDAVTLKIWLEAGQVDEIQAAFNRAFDRVRAGAEKIADHKDSCITWDNPAKWDEPQKSEWR